MVVTSNDGVAERVRTLRQHGSREKYHHEAHGYNSRLDALQAAILQVKLGHLDEWNEARRRCAHRYNELFADANVTPPCEADGRTHVYHQYTLRVPDRVGAMERLKAAHIGHAIYYPVPLHLQAVYRHLGYSEGDFPVTEAACREVLSLPIFPELTEEEQRQVAAAVVGE
jgi:dTDP-4-amino-4,6-dideoxygalactose transaminase